MSGKLYRSTQKYSLETYLDLRQLMKDYPVVIIWGNQLQGGGILAGGNPDPIELYYNIQNSKINLWQFYATLQCFSNKQQTGQ